MGSSGPEPSRHGEARLRLPLLPQDVLARGVCPYARGDEFLWGTGAAGTPPSGPPEAAAALDDWP